MQQTGPWIGGKQGRRNQGGHRGHVPPLTGEGGQAVHLYPPSWKRNVHVSDRR